MSGMNLSEMTPSEVARTIAYNIRAELVCCHTYDEHCPDSDGAEKSGHGLCYWGEAAARVAETTQLAGDVNSPCECAAPCPTCGYDCLGGHAVAPYQHWCAELHVWDDSGWTSHLVNRRYSIRQWEQ